MDDGVYLYYSFPNRVPMLFTYIEQHCARVVHVIPWEKPQGNVKFHSSSAKILNITSFLMIWLRKKHVTLFPNEMRGSWPEVFWELILLFTCKKGTSSSSGYYSDIWMWHLRLLQLSHDSQTSLPKTRPTGWAHRYRKKKSGLLKLSLKYWISCYVTKISFPLFFKPVVLRYSLTCNQNHHKWKDRNSCTKIPKSPVNTFCR